jgi:hypothetical protein
MIHERQILLTKTKYGKLSHEYGITQIGIKTLYMAISIILMDLVINQ